MVHISETRSMFWGITLENEKRYTQQVKQSFHVSMAALEPSQDPKAENRVSVLVQHSGHEYLLCTLSNKGPLQQPLDLNFVEDEEVTLFHTGKGRVHLTGYLAPEDDLLQESGMDDSDDSDVGVIDLDDSDDDDEEDDEEESDDEDVPQLKALKYDSSEDESEEEVTAGSKRKKKQEPAAKKAKLMLEEADEDDDDDESDLDDADIDQLMRSFEEDDDDDEDDDDEDESDEEESFITKPSKQKGDNKKNTPKDKKKEEVKKTPKSATKAESKKDLNQKQENKKTPKSASKADNKKGQQPNETPKGANQSDVADTPASSEKKKKKKKKKKNKGEENGETPSTPKQQQGQGEKGSAGTPASGKKKKQVLEGGVVVEDLKEGHGPAATPGKTMGMYYIGKLQNNQKEFDRQMNGAPFKFKLGKSEVIKGWDVGVKGMKVGGKRRITVPPKMGYGTQRQGPIPPNSTLVFDVELKAVS